MAVARWIERARLKPEEYLFPSRVHGSPHLSTRQYAQIVDRWIGEIGLDPAPGPCKCLTAAEPGRPPSQSATAGYTLGSGEPQKSMCRSARLETQDDRDEGHESSHERRENSGTCH
jgi:hypothetical protein